MIRKIKLLGLAALWSTLFYSCSAEWHVRRAEKLDPAVVSTKVDTLFLPEVSIDTILKVEKDTAGLSAYIDSILYNTVIPDSCIPIIKTIKEPILKYVDNMPVLLDTARYETTFEADGVLVHLELFAFQEGKNIRIGTKLIDSKVITETTTIVKPEKSKKGLNGFLIGFISSFILFLLILVKRK